jgi:BirA family biotin operon repressor/biotin-[acetyl-CoA-carboxylase] ligase
MDLDLSRRVVPRLIVRDTVASTNSELAALAGSEELPPFTTLVTLNQTAGRARLDRTWVAPPGASLAISVLVPMPAADAGWVPLAAGIAMRRAVDGVLEDPRAWLKWPNDVLIDDRKVCGILAEVLPAGIVIGAGLNIGMTQEQLPVPTATSLAIAGVVTEDGLVDRALASYLTGLRGEVEVLARSGTRSLRDGVRAACSTLGRKVHVELPDGEDLVGRSSDIDDQGRLVVTTDEGRAVPVAAGDVTHVRTAD